ILPEPPLMEQIAKPPRVVGKVPHTIKLSPLCAALMYVSRSEYPEAADHIQAAVGKGKVRLLTLDRDEAARVYRRQLAMAGFKGRCRSGQQRDEYPPATTLQGGSKASVECISAVDNNGAGNAMRWYLDAYRDPVNFF